MDALVASDGTCKLVLLLFGAALDAALSFKLVLLLLDSAVDALIAVFGSSS